MKSSSSLPGIVLYNVNLRCSTEYFLGEKSVKKDFCTVRSAKAKPSRERSKPKPTVVYR